MIGNNLPFWFQQFRYADGRPLAGGKLYTYVTESSIPKKVYYDVELTIPATNPVILDSAGYLPEIFLEAGLYTFELKDANDILIARRDNINSIDFDSIFQPFGYFLPLSGGTLSGTLSGTNIMISGGISATKFSMDNAEFIPGIRQHSIRLVGNDGPYSDYTATIGFGVEDKAVIGTLDGQSLNLSASFIELEGANTYIKKGNFIVGEFAEKNNVVFQDWGFLDQRGDARFDGTLSAKEGIIIPTKTSADILVADGSTINLSAIQSSNYYSAGVKDPIVTDFIDYGNGTAYFYSINVKLHSTSDFSTPLLDYNVPAKILSFVNGTESYVCVSYNNGTPEYYVETNKDNINESNIIKIWEVWREGNYLHSLSYDSKALGLSNKISNYVSNTTPYKKSIDGGLVLSETGVRNILVTSAIVYSGIVKTPVSAFNSLTDTLTFYYHTSGNWNSTNQTAYNNTQYDDGSNLHTFSNNKYGVRWFYRSIGDARQVFYVLGNAQYNSITEAQSESPRTDLPLLIRDHCVLIAKIIIQSNASSGIVYNVSDVSFSSSIVSSHNDLSNIQGGSVGEYYHLNSLEYNKLKSLPEYLQEPTGFIDTTSSVWKFNDSTFEFNISATSSSYNILYRGLLYTKTSDTITLPYDQGLWYIYFTSGAVLSASKTPWKLNECVPIALIYQDAFGGTILHGEERHGCVMDWSTHEYLHDNFGTRYTSGFNASYVLNSDTSAYFGLTNGKIADEDLSLTISQGSSGNYFTQQINYPGYIPVYWKFGDESTGAYGLWRKFNATNLPYYGWTNQLNYNYYSGGTWGQTPVSQNNYYVAFYIFATNNKIEPIISIQGQREDSSLDNARNNNNPNTLILTDFPTKEAKLLYRIILKYNSSYTNNPYRCRIEDVTDYRNLNINLVSLGGTGSVSYVALSGSSAFSIGGSPITNAGTFTLDFSSQQSKNFLASPSATSGVPTFRTITSADIPNLPYIPLSGGIINGNISATGLSAVTLSLFSSAVNLNNVDTFKISTTATTNIKEISITEKITGFGLGMYIKPDDKTLYLGNPSYSTTIGMEKTSAISISATKLYNLGYISATGSLSISNSLSSDNIIIPATSITTTADVTGDFLGRSISLLTLKQITLSFNSPTSGFYKGNVYSGSSFVLSANNNITLKQIGPNYVICT